MFLNFKKFKNTSYIYFFIFLFFTVLIEIIGYLFSDYFKINNNPIYSIYYIVTFLFYFIFYKNLFKNAKRKRILKFVIIIYLLFIPFDLLVLKTNYLVDYIVNNIVFGSILLTFTLILFLIEIINSEKIVFNIKKSLIFWITIGVLLFFIGTTPIIISSNYLGFDGIYDFVLIFLSIIMYGSFVIGFIKSDPKYNY